MELRQMTLSQAAEFDKQNGAAGKLTGWGYVCKMRSGENSKSQRRKRNAREERAKPKKNAWD